MTTLPENYSPWEHLQDMIRRDHNKVVARYFRDLGSYEDWKPNLNTPRDQLRTACTIQDTDTSSMVQIRLYYFYEVLGYGKKRLGIFYGMPARDFQESFEGRPQVFLVFAQDKSATPQGEQPITAEISFRLMDETASSMTPAKAEKLAAQIKSEMIEGNKGIVFTKGTKIITYTDKPNGYKLQIYTTQLTEGEALAKKVVGIRNHPFDEQKLGEGSKPKKNSLNNPTQKKLVYGKQQKVRRWRPTANVRFKYAYLYVHGLDDVVPLVDTTGEWWDAFVKV